MNEMPVLTGERLFGHQEPVFINRSNELPEFCNKLHRHDFLEICFVQSGRGHHQVGERVFEVTPGDVFIINYDVPHGFFSHDGSVEGLLVYNCVFMPEFLDASLTGHRAFSGIASSFLVKSLFAGEIQPAPDFHLTGPVFRRVHQLFENMHEEYRQKPKAWTDMLRACVIELLVLLFRTHEVQPVNHPTQEKNRRAIASAVEYMKEHFGTDVKLEDVASKSFLSRNYFSKLFREVTGITFSDYLQRLRVEEACRLLVRTDLRVIDIAQQVGFSDLKFFYELFRRHTGLTPGEYRQKPQ